MNHLRLFLSRGSRLARCLFIVVIAVMLSRALLSSVVMIDPDAPAGSFGLVICSGHGPMFASDNGLPDSPVMQRDGDMTMSMPGMVMPSSDNKIGASHTGVDTGSDTNSICPFSAALLIGTFAAAFVALFFGLVMAVRYRAPVWTITVIQSSAHRRPPSRAPPAFA